MKTYLDLAGAARQHVTLLAAEDAAGEIARADALIDVREESEYAAGHLPGAVHMSRGVIEARLSLSPQLHRPDARLVVYCRTDARAVMVAASLQDMGYTQVRVLAGGFEAWVAEGRQVQC